MAQHLYPCERCSKVGVAHYVLVRTTTAGSWGWTNLLLCTACWKSFSTLKEGL